VKLRRLSRASSETVRLEIRLERTYEAGEGEGLEPSADA